MEKLIRFGVSMDSELLEQFDRLIAEKGYLNRSKALRDLVRESLISEELLSPNEKAFGALVFIYDHHRRGLEQRLTELQHDQFQTIISTSHVHVDHDHCLEVILMQGIVSELRALADRILSLKGIQHGKLTLTTSL